MTVTAAGARGELDLWFERRGDGPDVLLIAGLGDPAEAWQLQLDGLADRYRVTAFDNRGVGRTPRADGPLSIGGHGRRRRRAHARAGRARRARRRLLDGEHDRPGARAPPPGLVRSLVLVSTYARPDALLRSQLAFWRWLPKVAPDERAFLEAFFTWVYTPRAHADGTVEQLVEEAVAFPHQQTVEAFQAQVDACVAHDTADRLARIAAPTLVLPGSTT